MWFDYFFPPFIIAAGYIIVVFIASRFIIPHLGWSEEKIPPNIPADMADKIAELKVQANSKIIFLELAYEYIGNRYFTGRLETLFKFSYLFKDFSEIWRISGYAPCTQSNFLLRIFLVRSGLFNSEDIKRKHVFFNFILHQYLEIKIENKWLCVDVGEKQRGMPLGQHLKWFG